MRVMAVFERKAAWMFCVGHEGTQAGQTVVNGNRAVGRGERGAVSLLVMRVERRKHRVG